MEEDLNDVDVQHQGGKCIVVDSKLDLVIAPDDHLSVEHDVKRKEKNAQDIIEHVHPFNLYPTERENGEDETEGAQSHTESKEIWPVSCEVVVTGPSIDGHCQKDQNSNTCRKRDALPSVHRAGEPYSDPHSPSIEAKEYVVVRKLPQHLLAAKHDTQRADHNSRRDVEHPYVALELMAIQILKRKRDGDSEQELYREDTVDLANEAHSNFPLGGLHPLLGHDGLPLSSLVFVHLGFLVVVAEAQEEAVGCISQCTQG
mmetsp:Transcript_79670/g.165511  ORF Transcript_79670/g.165511 Transcript_79670/m.165511 type:complete len:258 (-) Transcript_79670:53-826(-)